MIRPVQLIDAAPIAGIYNHYIAQTTVTFETAPVTVREMENRILAICKEYPYFVIETKGEITGYCYAHRWKEKEAYRHTAETTVYIKPDRVKEGNGERLMLHLIEACRNRKLHKLIACITYPNIPSMQLHEKLGFRQVSHFHEVGCKFGKWLDVCDYELTL